MSTEGTAEGAVPAQTAPTSTTSTPVVVEPEDPVKLFVGQVPRQMEEAELTKIFSPFGAIKELIILRDRNSGMHKGCAFVTYNYRTAAVKAIEELNEKITLHPTKRPVVVRVAGSDQSVAEDVKLFVGMLSKAANETQIDSVFSQYGKVKEVYLMRDHQQQSKGCCFVKFGNRSDAQKAINALHESHQAELQEEDSPRRLIVKYADSKAEKQQRDARRMGGAFGMLGRGMGPGWAGLQQLADAQSLAAGLGGGGLQAGWAGQQQFGGYGGQQDFGQQQGQFNDVSALLRGGLGGMGGRGGMGQRFQATQQARGPAGANLFIYNVPEGFTDADLHSMFSICGNVLSATVFKDKHTGVSRGFGFVSYDTAQSAEKAIMTLNGFQVPGNKRLKVMLKSDSQRGGGMQNAGGVQNRGYAPY
jgi:RNA recognition motif-containing protein